MSKNDNNKRGSDKVGGVDSAKKSQAIHKAESVSQVESIKATSGVGSVSGLGGVGARRKATKIMSAEEREKLLKMVDDEADKLFKSGAMPGANKELITLAVKMAVDSSIVLDADLPADTEEKK